MKLAVFSSKPYDIASLSTAKEACLHELTFLEARLDVTTAPLAAGHAAISAFVNDRVDSDVVEMLAAHGVELVALRSAGFNHVDLAAAEDHGLTVVHVPLYSPRAIAEHCLGLILSLNRHIHRAYNRVREHNFSIDGLLGFDLHGKTIGIVGTGSIGSAFAEICIGLGMEVVAADPFPNTQLIDRGVRYDTVDNVLSQGDIISLHCPLTPDTYHMVNAASLSQMKRGVMLINTSRGGLVDGGAVIDALKTGQVGHLGLDVYEEETDLFFDDRSEGVIQDDVFARLLTFPNVLVTGHQAFFTEEALHNIAEATLRSLSEFEAGEALSNEVALIR